MIRLAPRSHWTSDLVVVILSYELVAITTGTIPTLTALQRRYPFLAPVFLAGLAAHFYVEEAIIERLRARQLATEA